MKVFVLTVEHLESTEIIGVFRTERDAKVFSEEHYKTATNSIYDYVIEDFEIEDKEERKQNPNLVYDFKKVNQKCIKDRYSGTTKCKAQIVHCQYCKTPIILGAL